MSPTSDIFDRARREGRALLTEVEAKEILEGTAIPTTRAFLARTADEALLRAHDIGYPVALKVVSHQITHKSDVGGVKLNVTSDEQVEDAFQAIMESAQLAVPAAEILGVSVQAMAKAGIEVIVGMTTDANFGPVLMFGLGGVMVEVLKDVSFRVVPLEPRDADEMIREIKGFPLLAGHRGQPPSDIGSLKRILLGLSGFVQRHEQVREVDLNPVFVYPDGALVADARIILGEG